MLGLTGQTVLELLPRADIIFLLLLLLLLLLLVLLLAAGPKPVPQRERNAMQRSRPSVGLRRWLLAATGGREGATERKRSVGASDTQELDQDPPTLITAQGLVRIL